MDSDNVPVNAQAPDLQIWDRLLNEQTLLFRNTIARNVELETRVEELERELSVWKAALKTADDDKKTLHKTVSKLERSIDSLKEDNPLILCIIDGDGNIFSSDLLSMGRAGGRQAAMLLTKGLTDHLASIESPDATLPGRGQLWLTIYCNKAGLLETLTYNNVCSVEQFEDFVIGFNQASPLFSIVDVGIGKEAADAKVKECLRVFTRFPQTSKVFFGGSHDNGYTSTLTHLHNEGFSDKIILLRGYKQLAYEIKGLDLPNIEIEGLFMKKKLYTNSSKKGSSPNQRTQSPNEKAQSISQSMPPPDIEKYRSKSSTPSMMDSGSPTRSLKHVDFDQVLSKLRPPPCNFYYLAQCKHGSNCRFCHDYALSPAQLEDLRESALKWPCPYANRGQLCHNGENCIMGHRCPKGPQCHFAKQGKCKFVALGMHDRPNIPSADYHHQAFSSPSISASSPSKGLSDLLLSPLAGSTSPAQNGIYLPQFNINANRDPQTASSLKTHWSSYHNSEAFTPGRYS